MPTLLMSSLRRQVEKTDLAAFRAAHPYPWVVWEPGIWRPPSHAPETMMLPSVRPEPQPATGVEALAMGLVPIDAKATQVTLGRSADCDLEVNDATLSRNHALFMWTTDGRWTVRDAGARNGTSVDGQLLRPGTPQLLREGAKIQVGSVMLTFHTPEGMFERLQKMPPEPRNPFEVARKRSAGQ